MQKGQIFKVHSDFYYVHSDSGSYECKIREVLKKQKQKIFVGDYVVKNEITAHAVAASTNIPGVQTMNSCSKIMSLSAG